MCVSLICTNVSAPAGAASLLSPAANARGTPPATDQTTAAPLHAARQPRARRRPWSVSNGAFLSSEDRYMTTPDGGGCCQDRWRCGFIPAGTKFRKDASVGADAVALWSEHGVEQRC